MYKNTSNYDIGGQAIAFGFSSSVNEEVNFEMTHNLSPDSYFDYDTIPNFFIEDSAFNDYSIPKKVYPVILPSFNSVNEPLTDSNARVAVLFCAPVACIVAALAVL